MEYLWWNRHHINFHRSLLISLSNSRYQWQHRKAYRNYYFSIQIFNLSKIFLFSIVTLHLIIDKSVKFELMSKHWTGNRPLSAPMTTQFTATHTLIVGQEKMKRNTREHWLWAILITSSGLFTFLDHQCSINIYTCVALVMAGCP